MRSVERTIRFPLTAALLLLYAFSARVVFADPTSGQSIAKLERQFESTVQPFVADHCLDCHDSEQPEAQLDLSLFKSLADVRQAHPTWRIVLQRLAAHEMPPAESDRPNPQTLNAVTDWITALRNFDAHRNAGDPGLVLARRLSNAEYNYSIRDLTGVDLEPTKTFPVDPANEAGFDNSGESLNMSPALLNKYLAAARMVANHMVFALESLRFASHPVVTDTDRDKYCVRRIVDFYDKQPTDIAAYLFVCWQLAARDASATGETKALRQLADAAKISPKYALLVWELLTEREDVGPTAVVQGMFRSIPESATEEAARERCAAIRDYIEKIRRQLAPKFPNLQVRGSHKGSQPFVLWKNRQYAAHRQTFDQSALFWEGEPLPEDAAPALIVPEDEAAQPHYFDALERFCATFPDAFYISERGRDYLDKPRQRQEAGRLLSAGFHSMMGYFRDDAPLCDLILSEHQLQLLERLWQELDFVASAPSRQYSGFLWFERTDSRYMRDPVFDFARAEDKSAGSAAMIDRLAEVYLEKAQRNGGSPTALDAIEHYFSTINRQIRWVEGARTLHTQSHLNQIIALANRAWRRELTQNEELEIRDFYASVREEGMDHEGAIRDTLVFVLMSPHFLYRVDVASAGDDTRPLTAFELSSRLSYFLWSSLPDEQLQVALSKAERSQPQVKDTVKIQAERMLKHENVRGLAQEFAANWLGIRRFGEHNSVDRERFPEFTDRLRQAMYEEPMRFFVHLVQEDRPVLDLLYGDYTYVNDVLAAHYDIPLDEGSTDPWRRIPDAKRFGRGGLLPMAVFLTKNSPGLRTSPVKRGYWVVRNLLGEQIPPPPPNVPELPADEKQATASLREMLARHRNHESCAGCHERFDSIGLTFEGYGPVGEARRIDLGGRPIEDSARFPGGDTGRGMVGLKNYLRDRRKAEFLSNLCRKLLSYALGRTLVLSDEPLISRMREKLVADNYRFSSLVMSIVESRQFLYKRGHIQVVEVN